MIDFQAREVDLTENDQTEDFIYRNPIQISFTGFPELEGNCTVPVLSQSDVYSITIQVYEQYGDVPCPLESGELLVFDDIGDLSEPERESLNTYFLRIVVRNKGSGVLKDVQTLRVEIPDYIEIKTGGGYLTDFRKTSTDSYPIEIPGAGQSALQFHSYDLKGGSFEEDLKGGLLQEFLIEFELTEENLDGLPLNMFPAFLTVGYTYEEERISTLIIRGI